MIGRIGAIIALLAALAASGASDAQAAHDWGGEMSGRWVSLQPLEDLSTPAAATEPPTAEPGEGEDETADVPEEPAVNLWEVYFAGRPPDFLVDPDGLLEAEAVRARRDFLNEHAAESPIALYVYLFGGDADMPGASEVGEFLEPFFGSAEKAVVVFFALGEPERAALYLTPALVDAVPAAEQRRALQSAVMQAHGDIDPAGQLGAFLDQMAVRIYWMEGMREDASPGDSGAAEARARQVEGVSDAAVQEHAISMPGPPWLPGALALCVAGAGALQWRRARACHHFPDFEVEPRLGGRHAAGVGAVISFLNPSVRPASQRNQMPDYLRRM